MDIKKIIEREMRKLESKENPDVIEVFGTSMILFQIAKDNNIDFQNYRKRINNLGYGEL